MRFISFLLGSVFVITTFAAQAQSVKAPLPVEGNNWEFKTIDMWSSKPISELTKNTIGVSGDYVRMYYEMRELARNGEFIKPQVTEATIRADMNETVMYHGDKMEKIWYKWPLEPGKKWESQVKVDYPASGNNTQVQVVTTTYKAEVMGWETVEVPAGKFKALKIVYKINWAIETPISNGSSTTMVWYSPETKCNVQNTFESFGADGSPQTRTRQQLVQYAVK